MIVTCASKNYEKWLEPLLTTYRKSNPDKKAKVYLVMDDEDYKAYKSDEFVEYILIPTNESLNMHIDSTGRIRSVMRLKSSLILWELILNPDKFLWVDVDSLILKDITPLLNKLDEYDFLCTSRPWKGREREKLAAAVIGVAKRSHMVDFMAKSCIDIWKHWEGWFSEQLHFYRNITPDIKHYSFTENEHSLKANTDTIILSHHGNGYEDMVKIAKEL